MRAWSLLSGLALVTACVKSQAPIPSAAHIDRLEALLRSNECIGSLDRWERHYYFESEPSVPGDPSVRTINQRKIGFIFRQAGFEEFRNRRVIHSTAADVVSIDDRPYRTAVGTYDIPSARTEVEFCGSTI